MAKMIGDPSWLRILANSRYAGEKMLQCAFKYIHAFDVPDFKTKGKSAATLSYIPCVRGKNGRDVVCDALQPGLQPGQHVSEGIQPLLSHDIMVRGGGIMAYGAQPPCVSLLQAVRPG